GRVDGSEEPDAVAHGDLVLVLGVAFAKLDLRGGGRAGRTRRLGQRPRRGAGPEHTEGNEEHARSNASSGRHDAGYCRAGEGTQHVICALAKPVELRPRGSGLRALWVLCYTRLGRAPEPV